MYLTKTKNGYYIPSDDKSYEQSSKVKTGDEILAKRPRNIKHHRLAFALLNKGFRNQEKYKTLDIYRKVITILAGFYDAVPSKRGMEYIPKSISFESMSQDRFEEWYDATCVVVADDIGCSVEELKGEVEQEVEPTRYGRNETA